MMTERSIMHADMREQLLIIPTLREASLVAAELKSLAKLGLTCVNCGVGLLEAAVSASRLISTHQPKLIWLVGIAGRLEDQLEISKAYEFSQVACHGIGVGNGTSFKTPSDLAWESMMKFGEHAIVELSYSGSLQLLSVTATSNSVDEAKLKLQKFPSALAEDMEAYSIALQCYLSGIPCRVIRGISNQAGNRDHSQWRSAEAMNSAMRLFIERLGV